MTDKRKKLIRQLMKETGRSYCSVLNELRKGDLQQGQLQNSETTPQGDRLYGGPQPRAVAPKTALRSLPGGRNGRSHDGGSAATMPFPPPVIVFAGLKAGTGKTTAAISCATAWLAQGKRVLLVDGDRHPGAAAEWAASASDRGWETPSLLTSLSSLRYVRGGAGVDVVVVDLPSGDYAAQRSARDRADLTLFPVDPRTSAHILRDQILFDAESTGESGKTFLLLNWRSGPPTTSAAEWTSQLAVPTLEVALPYLRPRAYEALGSRFQDSRVEHAHVALVEELATHCRVPAAGY